MGRRGERGHLADGDGGNAAIGRSGEFHYRGRPRRRGPIGSFDDPSGRVADTPTARSSYFFTASIVVPSEKTSVRVVPEIVPWTRSSVPGSMPLQSSLTVVR